MWQNMTDILTLDDLSTCRWYISMSHINLLSMVECQLVEWGSWSDSKGSSPSTSGEWVCGVRRNEWFNHKNTMTEKTQKVITFLISFLKPSNSNLNPKRNKFSIIPGMLQTKQKSIPKQLKFSKLRECIMYPTNLSLFQTPSSPPHIPTSSARGRVWNRPTPCRSSETCWNDGKMLHQNWWNFYGFVSFNFKELCQSEVSNWLNLSQ